jgi:nucleotide-binding universal stress UspA family protein
MKTIIVATDFSPAAINAAHYAADMASAINADLLLLHVYHIPMAYTEVPITVNEDEIRQDVEKAFDKLKQKLTEKIGSNLNIRTEVRFGGFIRELEDVCKRVKPYTVVMGSHGTTAAVRLFFGSHTVHAMKLLEWPVIAVPHGAKFTSVRKIGLACDFDKVIASTPVDEIMILVNDFGAELHILNTCKGEALRPELVFESEMLQEMLKDLNPNYHFITNENIEDGIIDFAERNKIDLLVVLPKRRDLLNNLVHKSHTRQFVMQSHVPVMALHQ